MLFNSIEFLLFLPIVFLLYWFIFKKRNWQNILVVIASYVFYGWWDWRFLVLIFFTSFCSYVGGLLLEQNEKNEKARKAINVCNVIINLAILGYFKYCNFFVESLNSIAHTLFDYDLGWVTLKIILPVGISFYTFQALSYTIDVYKHSIKATHDPFAFFAYISFFPQLVAGPIERATNLLPQFQGDRHFDYASAVDGLRQMLWGFFKKMVVADNCATIVNQYWGQYQDLSGIMLVILGVLFSFQIYCDFSGYSDIAIGCARMFGINLLRNFNFPYFSRNIPEFWKRWHISLTTWFRNYIYFPLGGSHCSKWKTIRNVFIVWCVSGLWHGANWTFVCWGLYHAVLLNVYNLLGIKTKYETEPILIGEDGRFDFRVLLKIVFTFILAVFGWIIFRAETMSQAVNYFHALFSNAFINGESVKGTTELFFCAMLVMIEWFQRKKQHALQFSNGGMFKYRICRWGVYYLILATIAFFAGVNQTFIYFQF